MAWSGGNYTKGNNATGGWVGDASLGIGIEAGRHDTQDDDFATGINQCLNKDGSNAATGNLNLGGNKLTNIGAATARTDAAQTTQVQDGSFVWCGTSGGTANAQTLTPSPAITAYTAGQTFRFIAGFTPTGTYTINVSGLGAKNVKNVAGVNEGIVDLYKGRMYELVYDGTSFRHSALKGFADFNNGATGDNLNFYKSRGTEYPNNSIVATGDNCAINWWGANGTSYDRYAYIAGIVDATPGASNDMPGALSFATAADGTASATERMRITSSGNVGIGTTNPTSPLTVGDGTGQKIIVVNGANSGTGGGSAFTWQNGSNPIIAIGNYSAIYGGAYDASPTFYNGSGLAYRVGNMTAAVGTHFMKWHNSTGAWTYDTSSARYKDNIEDSSYGLAEVLAMRPVAFTYKAEPDRHDVGFIAEEMVNVVPEVIAKNTEGEPDAISYDRLTSVLCKAIQELNAKVEALEARIAALEA